LDNQLLLTWRKYFLRAWIDFINFELELQAPTGQDKIVLLKTKFERTWKPGIGLEGKGAGPMILWFEGNVLFRIALDVVFVRRQ
jgi:hypothetical protein